MATANGHGAATVKPGVRTSNLHALLHTLQRQQPISRVRLARETGISTTTVTNLTQELMQQGVLMEAGRDHLAHTEGAGRPPVALRLVPQSRCALGIHIGVRTVRLALVDLQSNILAYRVIHHQQGQSLALDAGAQQSSPAKVAAIIEEIACAAHSMMQDHVARAMPQRIVGIGIGASGLVESRTGVNLLAPRLGWHNVPLRSALLARLADLAGTQTNPPLMAAYGNVVVDNNVRCMALAESLYGVRRQARALVFVYAQVGVGAGIVVDGTIYRGADHGAGEIGHWVMTDSGGALCGCGNRGCLETYISESVLVELAERAHPELTRDRTNALETIFRAARDGHLALVEMLEARAHYLGLALANLVNVLNPQVILLGGWPSEAFDLVEPVVVRTMRRHAFGGLGSRVDILPTSFGVYSGVMGAAVLAFENFFFMQQ